MFAVLDRDLTISFLWTLKGWWGLVSRQGGWWCGGGGLIWRIGCRFAVVCGGGIARTDARGCRRNRFIRDLNGRDELIKK